MNRVSRWSKRVTWMAAISVLSLSVGTAPASAATATTVQVGSSPSVMASTTIYDPVVGKTVAISFAPEFNSHQLFSVNVTTFRMCFSMTGGGTALLKPQVGIAGSVLVEYGYQTFWSGTCQTYSLYRTFQASPGSELFRITGVLGGNGGPSGATVAGFNR